MKVGRDGLGIKGAECIVVIGEGLFCSFFVVHKVDYAAVISWLRDASSAPPASLAWTQDINSIGRGSSSRRRPDHDGFAADRYGGSPYVRGRGGLCYVGPSTAWFHEYIHKIAATHHYRRKIIL